MVLSTKAPPKSLKAPPYSWKPMIWSIGLYLKNSHNIDRNPVGQRPDSEDLDKKQGIIRSIFKNIDICEISIRKMKKLPDGTYEYDFVYRSVDGGHRKRSIKEFVDGEFKTGAYTEVFIDGDWFDISNKYFHQLDERIQKIFFDYELRFVVYDENMTDRQAGETFRLRNQTTDVNDQEQLNSYENNKVAQFVREISRKISGLPNEPHDLFELNLNEKKKTFKYLKKNPLRLYSDTVVTRILSMINKGSGLVPFDKKTYEDAWVEFGDEDEGLWVKHPDFAKKAQARTIKVLDFILNYGRVMKSKTKSKIEETEVTMLVRYFIVMNQTLGENGWSINDWDKFFLGFKKTFESFHKKDDLPSRLTKIVYGERTIAEAFKGHLGVFNNQSKMEQSVKWFFEEMRALKIDDQKLGITIKDTKRSFSQRERLQKWLDQDGKCAVTGEDLPFKDSVSGHIKAHSKGGKTKVNNLAVIHKDKNTEMGTLDLDQYIDMK